MARIQINIREGKSGRRGERERTQVGGRCYTKESGRNNVREINARDAVTGYGEQKRHGNRHTYYAEIEIEIGREREGGEEGSMTAAEEREKTTED